MSAYHHYLSFVVKHDFGPLVQQLVSALLTHGPLSLSGVVHYSGLPASQARKALVIAIQHDIVVAQYEKRRSRAAPVAPAEAAGDAALDVRVLYRMHDAALRGRPRFASYILKAKDRHGDDAALIVQCLCMHGILTTQQLLDHALALHHQQLAAQPPASSPSHLSPSKRSQLESALHILSSGGFIKRAIMAKTSGTPSEDERDDEQCRADVDDGEAEFLSEAEMKKRKREEEKKEKEKKGRSGRRGKKKDAGEEERERELQQAEEALQRRREEEEAERKRREDVAGLSDHWTLNHVTFTLEMQRDAMIAYARDRISPSHAFVLAALLTINPFDGNRSNEYEEERIMEAVTEYSKEHANGPKITSTLLHALLVELSTDPARLLLPRGVPPVVAWALNSPGFLAHLQLLQAQSILTARFSLLAARIYRVLSQHSRLEESQLAELCTASRQSVRETLHELMKEEWVSLYEVPRTVDRAPSKTFFLWGVASKRVQARVRDLMFLSSVKALERESSEREHVQSVLDKLDMQQRIGEKERARVDKWQLAVERLELAQHKIQDMLAVWHE